MLLLKRTEGKAYFNIAALRSFPASLLRGLILIFGFSRFLSLGGSRRGVGLAAAIAL